MKAKQKRPPKTRPRGSVPTLKKRFLRYLAQLARIHTAAQRIGISDATLYRWRRSDRNFSQATAETKDRAPKRPSKATAALQKQFLRHWSVVGRLKLAAARAGISYQAVHQWTKRYPDFASDLARLKPARPIPKKYFGRRNPRPYIVAPPKRSKRRANGHGHIHYGAHSVRIHYIDARGQERSKNIGYVTADEAERIRAELTKPYRETRRQETEALKQMLSEIRRRRAKAADTSQKQSKVRKPGRPHHVSAEKNKHDCQAAATMKPREWCAVRDRIGFPLTPTVEQFGSWVNAYDSKDDRIQHYLGVKKAEKAREFRQASSS